MLVYFFISTRIGIYAEHSEDAVVSYMSLKLVVAHTGISETPGHNLQILSICNTGNKAVRRDKKMSNYRETRKSGGNGL